MYTNVPLVMASTAYGYSNNSYTTYVQPSPIRTHVSSLGSAAFNKAIVTSPVSTIIDSVAYSPTSSVIFSPYSYTTSPTSEQIAYSKRDDIYDVVLSPTIVNKQTTFLDINADPELQNKTSKYFYEKLMNRWLHGSFESLLNYFVVRGSNVKLVSKIKDAKKNSPNEKDRDHIIEYISRNIMTKYDVRSFLKKFVTKSGLNWYDLEPNTKIVKKSMFKRMKKTIENMIEH